MECAEGVGRGARAHVPTLSNPPRCHLGQHDNLDFQKLRDHLKAKPLGVRTGKRESPPRWRTWAITLVADTIKA